MPKTSPVDINARTDRVVIKRLNDCTPMTSFENNTIVATMGIAKSRYKKLELIPVLIKNIVISFII